MNKSAQSCIWSIQELLKGKKFAYLWTFTFRERLEIPEACLRWQHLQRDLVRSVGFRGVRVYELHPGGHGLHIHVVTSGRHDVNVVRHFSENNGFGRIHVKPIPAKGSDYIAKYLTKARRDPALKGRRLWSCLGFKGVRVSDCEVDSPISREIKKISTHELKAFYRRNNWCFPSSERSVNFAKFIWAQHRVLNHELRVRMRKWPQTAMARISSDESKFLDAVSAWIDAKQARARSLLQVLEPCEVPF